MSDLFRMMNKGVPANHSVPPNTRYEAPGKRNDIAPMYNSYEVNKAKIAVKNASEKITKAIGQRDLLLEQRNDALNRKLKAEQELQEYDLVQILLQKTSDYARQQAKQHIEEIVTQALNVVFGKDYRFIIELSVKSNQPVAEYFLQSGDIITKLEKPDYDRGGGTVDVISLALRLAVGELQHIEGPLFFDEVGKHVSAEYAANVAYFLKEYSSKFNRQIVLITHNTALAEAGDVSLQVSQLNGESVVKTI